MSTRATFQTRLDDTSAASTAPRRTLATSSEIRDRGSAFVGYVYRATTRASARTAVQSHHETYARKEAYHTIAAWRCMVVKEGRSGLGGPDEFEVEEGCVDGGERWAGRKVLGVMQQAGVLDAVVVVSRWYGGTLLGPVRFTHIETCGDEVCRKFKKMDEMDECVKTLHTLDDLLAVLRAELALTLKKGSANQEGSSLGTVSDDHARAKSSKAPDYHAMQECLDLTKAKKLIHVRERAINNTKVLIEKYKTST